MTTFVPPPSLADLLLRIAGLLPPRLSAFAVGGTIRDTLLERPARDVDITVADGVFQIARSLAEDLGGHFVELDHKNEVARVVLEGEGLPRHVDVARLQGTLEEDLHLRDFTINALAAPLDGGEIIDIVGGLNDLVAKVVRMTSPEAFEADPIRLLRAVRLAAELRFDIEPQTATAIRAQAASTVIAAGERQRDELMHIFALQETFTGLQMLDELALLGALLAEVTLGRGVTQPENWHVYDVMGHNMHAVEALDTMLADSEPPAPGTFLWHDLWAAFEWHAVELRAYLAEPMTGGRTRASLLKLATLLHDVGKPQTRTVDAGGRIRFLGHGEQGAAIARRIMRRLRFSASEISFVSRLVEHHLRPVQLAAVGEIPTRRALYRFFRELGDAFPSVLLLSLADAAGSRGPKMTSVDWKRHVAYMNSLLVHSGREEGILDQPRLLNGREIMSRLNLPAGPAIGELLEALHEAQAAGEIANVDMAWAFVRERAAANAAAAEAANEA